MEVNQPLPSNEELLISSDTPSSKCIQYGMSAINGLSATSTQSKSRNKLQDSVEAAGPLPPESSQNPLLTVLQN